MELGQCPVNPRSFSFLLLADLVSFSLAVLYIAKGYKWRTYV